MNIINRTAKIDEIRGFVRKDIDNGGNTYHIMIDNRNGCVVLIHCTKKSKYYNKIGMVDTRKIKPTIKNVNAVASKIRKDINTYNKTCLISYNRAVSVYGKKKVTDIAFVKEVDNPYYKCAAPMRLYDKNVIEYYINCK
ncbi:MAG: hypothetical protein J5529_13885 [Prevotella sp.]|nr:hypothetical protein [Prevotella sp.]